MGSILRVQILILLVVACYIWTTKASYSYDDSGKKVTIKDKGVVLWKKSQRRIHKKYCELFVNKKEFNKYCGYDCYENYVKVPKPVTKTNSTYCITDHKCICYKWLTNIHGEFCRIVHLPACDLYQFQCIGVCRYFGPCYDGGKCVQRYMHVRMLAHCWGKKRPKIYLFAIPSCCECYGYRY